MRVSQLCIIAEVSNSVQVWFVPLMSGTTVAGNFPICREESTKRLGADHFVVSKDKDAMSQVANSFDGIIDTVSADHPLPDYLVGPPDLNLVIDSVAGFVDASCSLQRAPALRVLSARGRS